MRIAINGFGRIGRSFLRALVDHAPSSEAHLEVVAVNDLADAATLAHLLAHDSTMGAFREQVALDGGTLTVAGRKIAVFAEKDPGALPWDELRIDLVVESTGLFTRADDARAHLDAGAGRVLISAPASGEDITLAYGINHDEYDASRHRILSAASCTTNCLAPLAKVLDDAVGITHGSMTTVHAYTQDQNLQDGPHKDLRRARAAAINLVPTTTGAARSIGRVLPSLQGKLDGYSLRVPVPVGSLTDLTVQVARDTSVEEVDAAFAAAAAGPLGGILAYTAAPLVSQDIVGNPASCVYDSGLTKVVDGRLVKVAGWYDNESGFSHRMVDIAVLVGSGT